MTMQTANRRKKEIKRYIKYLKLEVGGVKTYTHVFVVQLIPY